ncbi:MAG: type VII toxin-antitoxin system MntA family adenylyltransferase antitoxin [Thermodesulfobacteriota bacterium]
MKKEIKEEFKRLGIAIIYLFGSKVTRRNNRLSDIDIGVVFKDSSLISDSRKLYNDLFLLFSEVYPRSKIDIVFLQKTPFSLEYSAIKNSKILFEEDPIFTADYEYAVINRYLDFRPVLDFFDHVGMERYAQK